MVIGASLVVLLALLAGLCLAGVWRHLTRQLTCGGLVVFLIGAGIATRAAQKRIYVDINLRSDLPIADQLPANVEYNTAVRTITEAFEWLDGKVFDDVDIYVAPGVYPPVVIPDIEMGDCPYPIQLTPYFDVLALGELGSIVIDGQGGDSAISYEGDYVGWLPRQWHGIVLSNAVCGATCGFFARCAAVDCDIGFAGCSIEQCLVYGNKLMGAYRCGVTSCLIADNHASAGGSQWFEAAGAQGCSLEGTILWNNTRDGEIANWADCRTGWYGCNCTLPALEGEGNISADPMFVNASARDYHLKMGSPCINGMADGFSLWEWERDDWHFDVDLQPRFQRRFADIGPYEYQPTNDHQTITAPEPVEFSWIEEKCSELLAACGGDYDKVALMKSANPVDSSLPEPLRTYYSIWESYVADLDPSDSNQTFRATIEMVGGEPHVTADPESTNRIYTVLGKENLADEKWQENLPEARFFKVKVDLKWSAQ